MYGPLATATLDRALISTLMHSSHRFADVQAFGVSAEWFDEPICGQLWEAMEALHAVDRMFDYVTLREVMIGRPEDLPLLSQIAEVDESGLSEAFLLHMTRHLKLRMARKASASVCVEITTPSPPETPDSYAERLAHEAGRLHEIANDTAMSEILDQRSIAMRASEEVIEAANRPKGAMTGIATVDTMLGGMRPGEMFVIGARPGIGKSSFATTVTENTLRRDPESVVFYASVEMPAEEVYKRLIGIRSTVSRVRIERGQADEEELSLWRNAARELRDSPAHVEFRGMQSAVNVLSAAKRLRDRKARLDLVIVDGLHAMRARGENRTAEVTHLSAAMREIAAELSVPVLVCVQLNRAMESRENKLPGLSDLRDSGALEQDADVVMFLHRPGAGPKPDGSEPGPAPSFTQFLIAKHRRAATGALRLHFHEELCRFSAVELHWSDQS